MSGIWKLLFFCRIEKVVFDFYSIFFIFSRVFSFFFMKVVIYLVLVASLQPKNPVTTRLQKFISSVTDDI